MKKTLLLTIATTIALGAFSAEVPPCTLAIDSEEAFSKWVSIDANADGGDNQFKYNADKKAAYYVQNTSKAADDWLISPAITVEKGKSYKIIVRCQNLSTYSFDKQDFTVTFGSAATVEAQSNNIFKVTGLINDSWMVDNEGTFTADASGDIHIGLHLTSKSYQGDFAVESFKIEEQIPYPGAVTDLTAAAGANGALEVTLNWKWPVKNNLGGDGMDCTGASIYRGTTKSFTANDASLIANTDKGGKPGESAEFIDNTLTEGGKYYYKVIPKNADGPSPVTPVAVEIPWVGPDKSLKSLTNVVASAVEGNDKAISLTWDAPEGANGGYVDATKVAYTIKRSDNGATAVTVAEAWTGQLPYIDETIPGLGSYKYTVYTVYNGSTSFSGSSSNVVMTGGTMALPYSNDFSSSSSIDLFTMIHSENVNRDWSHSSSKNALNYWGTPADAYAILPVFELQPGKAYEISFGTYVYRSSSPKNLSVCMGTEPTVSGLTNEIYRETISNTYSNTKNVVFSVKEAGNYYLAFHVDGDSDSNDIYVDDLFVKEIDAILDSVSEAKATAAPEGALSATISWKNPVKNNAGVTLTSITRVDVLRGEQVIGSVSNPEPGSASSITDSAIDAPGVYSYTIIPYLDDKAGNQATAETGWVGLDTPLAPANLTVTTTDNGRVISFSPVKEGKNGGYINVADMKYNIMRDSVVLIQNLVDTTFTDPEMSLPLAAYVYRVTAISGNIESEPATSEQIIFGDALELPYKPDFSNEQTFDLWYLPQIEGKDVWKFNSSDEALYVSSANDTVYAFTPPFKALKGKITVTFKATCWSYRYPENVTLMLTTNDNPADIGTVGEPQAFKIETANYPDETTAVFDIPKSDTYHVAYIIPKLQWEFSLLQSDIEQTETAVDTGIADITADTFVTIYNIQGLVVAEGNGPDTLRDLGNGIFIVHAIDSYGNKSVFKITK